MITVADFSQQTLESFKEAKSSKSFIKAFDFAQLLYSLDFPVCDIKSFLKQEFPNDSEFITLQ